MPPYPQFWGENKILAPLPPMLGGQRKFQPPYPQFWGGE